MNSYKYFVGLDLGKTTNAVCVLDEQENRCFELKLPNTQQGMQTLLEKLQTLDHFELTSVLICAEYTGVYCQPLISFFGLLGADLWLQSAVHIKHSLGLKRGKTDKADARLIAKYCLRHQADKRLFVLTDNTLSVLRQLA